jgi:uncharacterized protein YndB with AHSA1/START domain
VTASGEDAIRRATTVAAPLARAFTVFTEGLGGWWPAEYMWSSEVLEEIGIEPRGGGRCYERGPHGFWCDWGRVLAWDPPHRLVFSWQIGPDRTPQPDPARASEVEVRFVEEGETITRVDLEHRAFARHGEEGDSYREGLGSSAGWTRLLDRYAAAVAAPGP